MFEPKCPHKFAILKVYVVHEYTFDTWSSQEDLELPYAIKLTGSQERALIEYTIRSKIHLWCVHGCGNIITEERTGDWSTLEAKCPHHGKHDGV